MATASTKAVAGSSRYNELKAMLEDSPARACDGRSGSKSVTRGPTASSSETCSIRARAQRSTSRTRSDLR